MPSRFAVRAMRQAISPRLAMRTEANMIQAAAILARGRTRCLILLALGGKFYKRRFALAFSLRRALFRLGRSLRLRVHDADCRNRGRGGVVELGRRFRGHRLRVALGGLRDVGGLLSRNGRLLVRLRIPGARITPDIGLEGMYLHV